MTPTLRRLTVEHLTEPLGLWTPRPRFSWVVEAPEATDVRQTAYELEVTGPDLELRTGRVASDASVLVDVLERDLAPATAYDWRVRVWTTAGDEPTAWATAHLETSVTDGSWHPVWVEPHQEPVTPDGPTCADELFTPPTGRDPADRLHPVILLRQRLTLRDTPVRARLRATAQGVYAAELNGRPVGDEVLAPGYESYHHRLPFQTYDVTALLTGGENVLGVQLGDGWFAGRIAMAGISAQYGDRLRATWRLEVTYADGTTETHEPGPDVRSTTDGPVRYSDLFIGERHDARRRLPGWSTPAFDDTAWAGVAVVEVGTPVVPFLGEPVRRVLELPCVAVFTTPAGETVADFGQVVAGRVRLRVRGPAGTAVTLEHGEVLDADGCYCHNIAGWNKDQTDTYVLAGDPEGETWEPLFTFHGFRYVRLTGWPGTPTPADLTAVVLASDLPTTSGWESSDPSLDQLHRNTVWSARGNLLSIPTDCPQRERAGWTGDLQVFAPTAATLLDVAAFCQRWLANLRLEQAADDGTVPVIVPVPPVPMPGDEPGGLFVISAAAGWGDVITVLPTVLWRRYGDRRFLADNLDAMRAWVEVQRREAAEHLPARLRDAELTDQQRVAHALLWNGVANFGDWLTPSLSDSADPDSIMAAPRRTGEIVGPLFQGLSLDLVADACDELGLAAEAAGYREEAAAVRQAFAEVYLDGRGRLPVDLQGPYVLALRHGFVPDDQVPGAVARLVRLVHEHGDRLDTGFLSVPHLLDVLWEHGHADLARTLLWQREAPSWLYQVDRGATTTWESWDAIKPDGTVGTSSFNHYAFGCVVDVLYRRLAGIVETAPGFRTSRVTPDLDGPLHHVAAHVDTPYGRLAVRWDRDGDRARLDLTVPVGTTTEVAPPPGWSADGPRELGSGSHTVTLHR